MKTTTKRASKKYATMYERLFNQNLARGYRYEMASDGARNEVDQRREADELDARMATGLPKHETPLERAGRYIAIRRDGTNYDDATRIMFEQDVRAMKTARPNWDADRCAQEIRDRSLYRREGYSWTVRIARATLGEVTS